jgi:hypothetical protein
MAPPTTTDPIMLPINVRRIVPPRERMLVHHQA